MIITEQVLEQGLSSNGAYSYKQLKCLGTKAHKNPGWRDKLIGSSVPDDKVEEFLSLKDEHLQKNAFTLGLLIENRKLKKQIKKLRKALNLIVCK